MQQRDSTPSMASKRTGSGLFPGGPGRTTNPKDFNSLMTGLEPKIFGRLPDTTWVYPGHGNDSALRRGAPAPGGMARPRLVGLITGRHTRPVSGRAEAMLCPLGSVQQPVRRSPPRAMPRRTRHIAVGDTPGITTAGLSEAPRQYEMGPGQLTDREAENSGALR